MKKLTSHFVIFLCTILLLVVGTTDYWLYKNNAEHLKNSFDLNAHNQLGDVASLSSYYISHYEFELLENLIADAITRNNVIYASVKTTDGDINITEGQYYAENSRQYSRDIIYNHQHLGTMMIALDDSLLKQELQQTLINSIFLASITVLLLGTLLILFFRCRVTDIMKLALTEKELADQEKEFFSIVMDSASSLVIVLEENGQIVLTNSICERYFSDNLRTIRDKSLWDYFSITCKDVPLQDLLDTDDKATAAENIAYLKENSCTSLCEIDHEKAIIEWSFNTLHDDNSGTTRLIATGVDVTAQHLKSEKLSYLAMHDSLTGLPNRSLFMDRLHTSLAQYNRNDDAFCLLYLDLDGFKPINDSLGHEAGDFILKTIAVKLQENLREVDTVARLGGDEFGIILTNIKNRENAATVAQKCIDAISQPFQYLSHQLQLGISVGIAYYPDHKNDLLQLISFADMAMYQAKRSGGNTYCFYEDDVSAKNASSMSKPL